MQNMNENLLEWHKQIKTMEEKNIPVVHVLIKCALSTCLQGEDGFWSSFLNFHCNVIKLCMKNLKLA